MTCTRCQGERWVCGQHPERGWPHDDCAGPGVPCPECQPGVSGGAELVMPPGGRSLITEDEDS